MDKELDQLELYTPYISTGIAGEVPLSARIESMAEGV